MAIPKSTEFFYKKCFSLLLSLLAVGDNEGQENELNSRPKVTTGPGPTEGRGIGG
jgi:hypothetical protein